MEPCFFYVGEISFGLRELFSSGLDLGTTIESALHSSTPFSERKQYTHLGARKHQLYCCDVCTYGKLRYQVRS